MFIRFRHNKTRLQVSLLEVTRLGGKVRNEHIASFGSIEAPQTVDARVAFWQRLHDRFAKLGNRLDAAAQAKLFGDIHAKIPMPTLDEQRRLQLRNAEADEQLWSNVRGMAEDTRTGHQKVAEHGERTIADSEQAIINANEKVEIARNRVERLNNGEAVSGGLGKPRTREDTIGLMGLTPREARQFMESAELSECFGSDRIVAELLKSHERAKRATMSLLIRKKRVLFGRSGW